MSEKKAPVRFDLDDLQIIPSGLLALDYAMGTGGFPRGTFTGIFGPRNVGKSLLALNAAVQAQNYGLKVAYIDAEADLEPSWAAMHGVNLEHFYLTIPETTEEAFESVKWFAESGYGLIIVDSIATLVPQADLDKGMEPTMGNHAKAVTKGLQYVRRPVRLNHVAVLLLNQTRQKLDRYGGTYQPGGNALEFSESVIIELRSTKNQRIFHPEHDKNKTDGLYYEAVIGREVLALINRNKKSEGDNWRSFYRYYNMHVSGFPFGMDLTYDIVNTSRRLGLIKQSSSWLELPDGTKKQGEDKLVEYILGNPEAYQELRREILTKMVERGGKLVLEL